MGIVSLVIGIISLGGVVLSMYRPWTIYLYESKWVLVPSAMIGALLGLIELRKPGRRHGFGIAGLVINLFAVLVGGYLLLLIMLVA